MNTNVTKLTATDRAIGAISDDFDFKMYLEAVVTASKRTRATLYVLVLTVIVICASYRNLVWPDWTSSRLSMLQKAHAAATQPDVVGGREALAYANGYLFQSPLPKATDPPRPALQLYDPRTSAVSAPPSVTPESKSEALRELEVQIDTMIRKRTELTVIQLPVLGIQIDMNDLGIVGGAMLITILYALRASIRREGINLNVATQRTAARNPDNLELLLMAQVLAYASIEKKHSAEERFLSNAAIYLMICLPLLVQFWICIDDTRSWTNGAQLIGSFWNTMELAVEWLTTLIIALLGIFCIVEQRQVNKAFCSLERRVERAAGKRDEKARRKASEAPAPVSDGTDQVGI